MPRPDVSNDFSGMVMNGDSSCNLMQGQRVKAFPGVESYPVKERFGFIWVWPGDASQADTSLIPDFNWFDEPDWVYARGLYHINCNYNLMDLTHEMG